MVSLRANQTRQGTSRIAIRLQAPDDVGEVISGTPPELLASKVVDIYPPNTGEHFPVPPLIFRFVFRDPLSYHSGCVNPQTREIFAVKWCGCAYDVFAKAKGRCQV